MTHDTNFVTELRNGFNSLANLINERINVLDADIETQIGVIANAYGEIKADKAELVEIGACVNEFVTAMGETKETANNSYDEAVTVIEDMYDLVDDGYIVDEDYDVLVEDGEEVAVETVTD